MDVQLQELIDRIKSEGVEQAQEKAEQIVAEAQRSAVKIIEDARTEAGRITQAARDEADKSLRAGREALAQAGRDLLLGLSHRIERLFARVVEEQVAKTLSGDVLERAVVSVFESMKADHVEGAELTVSESESEELFERLRAKLAEKVRGGVTVTPSDRISAGFRVTVENGTAYYNFTPREIAEVLATFLNPRLAEALKNAVSEE